MRSSASCCRSIGRSSLIIDVRPGDPGKVGGACRRSGMVANDAAAGRRPHGSRADGRTVQGRSAEDQPVNGGSAVVALAAGALVVGGVVLEVETGTAHAA